MPPIPKNYFGRKAVFFISKNIKAGLENFYGLSVKPSNNSLLYTPRHQVHGSGAFFLR